MHRLIFALIILWLCVLCTATANAEYARSKKALRAFVAVQACPSTGLHRLPCPGWQVDHVVPLKCLGLDAPENMQWLTVAEHKDKTRLEAKECRK